MNLRIVTGVIGIVVGVVAAMGLLEMTGVTTSDVDATRTAMCQYDPNKCKHAHHCSFPPGIECCERISWCDRQQGRWRCFVSRICTCC